MKVLVDTSVWSEALRQKEPRESVALLKKLILHLLVVIIGPIRQELLSSISDENMFLRLQEKLEAFEDLPIQTRDYETAAQFFRTCQAHGIRGSHVDFLICAVAHNNNLLIFTLDNAFEDYARYLPVRLFKYPR
jgi:predicted nucleic acid-binding protein